MQTPDYATVRFEQFAHAYAPLGLSVDFKTCAEDFVVDEHLPFALSGEGEHAWLHIQKRGCNTDWVAKQLAKVAGVRARNVSYAGLKDRHGITSQWFSVQLPGQPDPDWRDIESDEITVLEAKRHGRKLRRGALKENRFQIHLRNLAPDNAIEQFGQRCRSIAQEGVPNYFGEQRFGHHMGNLLSAEQMFSHPEQRIPRHQKSLYLSAARSWIFNQVLSERIHRANWNRRIQGDAFMLEGKSACFQDDTTPDIDDRLLRGDIHPTAVLWGEGEQLSQGATAELERAMVDANPVFRDGLLAFKVQAMRRALRVIPGDMHWQAESDGFSLAFNLPAGSYATMVLRELVELRDLGGL